MGSGNENLANRLPAGVTDRRGRNRVALVLGVSVMVMWLLPGAVGGRSTSAAATAGDNSWTVYHQDSAGTGVDTSAAAVNTPHPAWTSPGLDGQIYGEPLVSGGQVFVATENDTVYSLSSSTGAIAWSTHLGTPVPSGSLPCGDISPTVGITGTPVIDPTRSEIFVVADELQNGSPVHVLVGLDTTSGRTEMTKNVDPTGAKPAALLQRTGLTLDANQVVFGFGGNYGDCSMYRGWLVGVNESGGAPVDFAVDSGPGESQGAIWMGGAAPEVDSDGNLWIGVGNGSVTTPGEAYDYSDSVLELSSTFHLLQYFAPTSWASDNAHDLDLSMAPALLADGQVVASGKSAHAYLLNGGHLEGIGGQESDLASVCGDDVDGGTAVMGTTVFLPCLSGIVALQVGTSPARLQVLWTSHTGGGPPIIAADRVWTIGQDGMLSGLNPTTGAVEQQAAIGTPVNHFPTPSVGSGVLVAAAGSHVVAFAAPPTSSSSRSSTTTLTTLSPARSPAQPRGGFPVVAIIALAAGAAILIGVIAWFVRRRARSRPV
ncbi:MAG TPA: PQQ-binding-like beta-propeller repeat protein [Acidimicrobiales bacterium]|jgi:outer membrane protein assembly factor BamB|nr:PQQ-binding-like beta-propeller repeat protein [Acidimicrobiales bacterium]